MNIIDLNKQFYYQFHNRIYQSDPIYEFVPFARPISVSFKGSAGLEKARIREIWNFQEIKGEFLTWNINLWL